MTGDSSVIDPSAAENVHAQARGQPRTRSAIQSPRGWPRRRDGALVGRLVWKGCARPRQACGDVGHLVRHQLASQRFCCRTRGALAEGRSASSQPCARALERRLTGLLPVLVLCDSRSAVARAAVWQDDRHHRKPVVGARSPSRRAGHQGPITPSWPSSRRLDG